MFNAWGLRVSDNIEAFIISKSLGVYVVCHSCLTNFATWHSAFYFRVEGFGPDFQVRLAESRGPVGCLLLCVCALLSDMR